jgi:uncharacterized repeat protein (TIGR03803 family)
VWRIVRAVILLCMAMTVAASAQTFTTLASFNGTKYVTPAGSFVQGTDGDFYGVSSIGGVIRPLCFQGCGTVLKVSRAGTITVLHAFCSRTPCPDGYAPSGVLVRGGDGNFYGTTAGGGRPNNPSLCPNGCGTVFRITPTGRLATLYSFCALANCADGSGPIALMQSFDDGGGSVYGDFYGTTTRGGVGDGIVFRMTPGGQMTTVYNIGEDFNFSFFGQLIQTLGGNFYGAAALGGAEAEGPCISNGCGAIFRMTPAGTVTPLHVFASPATPNSPLVQGDDGFFYGTTYAGGAILGGCKYGCGTAFKISAAGIWTALHTFCDAPCSDGSSPTAGLILATDGNLYGTTAGEGNDCPDGYCPGSIFSMTPSGTVTPLHTFCANQPINSGCPGGSGSAIGLLQATDGKFYGATGDGGTSGDGTVFSVDVGLAPFVAFLTSEGCVGKLVGILGQGFTGTTEVSFNGTPASFTVKSDTYLTAIVPAGATTGFVSVTTPSGTLASNVVYQVTH